MTVTERGFTRPAADVFSVLVNPNTYPKWLVGAKRIREVSPDWPQPGSSFAHVVGFGPLAIPDRTTVREVEPSRMLELLVRARPAIEAVVRFEIEPSDPGCTLRMTETPVGIFKIAAPILQPLVRLRNERSLNRLAGVVGRQFERAGAAD